MIAGFLKWRAQRLRRMQVMPPVICSRHKITDAEFDQLQRPSTLAWITRNEPEKIDYIPPHVPNWRLPPWIYQSIRRVLMRRRYGRS